MANSPAPAQNGPYTALPANAPNQATGGNIMPSAGHYADMQTLMQNLDALSGWLQQNREEFDGLRDGLSRVGVEVNGAPHPLRQVNGVEDDSETISKFQSELQQSQQQVATLESQLQSYTTLHNLFTTTLTETMRLIRNYTYQNQTYISSLHHHYTRLLQDARFTTLEAQITHQKWQESLSRVNESCREALEEQERQAGGDEETGLRAEVKGLRWENRLLRRKVGWKEIPYSDEEMLEEELLDQWGEQEGERQRQQSRAGRGSIGVGDGAGVIT